MADITSPIYQSSSPSYGAKLNYNDQGINQAQEIGNNIQNSVPAAASATPVGMYTQAAGSVISTIGSMFKGSPEQNGKLPFELEKQMILDSQNNLNTITQNLEQSRKVYDAYQKQYDTLKKIQSSAVPSAADMRALQNSNIEIAQAFGGNTLAAIKAGFLDEDTARISGLIEGDTKNLKDNLKEVMSADFRDPNLENQLMNDRRKLEQQLARDGVPPQQRAQALQQFDQQAQNNRFSRTEELRNDRLGQLTNVFNATTSGYNSMFNTLQAGKNQSFQQAVQGFGQVQAGYNQGQSAISNAANLNNSSMSAFNDFAAGQNNLINTQGNIYNNIASTPLSLRTRGALGDKVSYSHGFLGLQNSDPSKDAASLKFRTQYQSAKQRRFANAT